MRVETTESRGEGWLAAKWRQFHSSWNKQFLKMQGSLKTFFSSISFPQKIRKIIQFCLFSSWWQNCFQALLLAVEVNGQSENWSSSRRSTTCWLLWSITKCLRLSAGRDCIYLSACSLKFYFFFMNLSNEQRQDTTQHSQPNGTPTLPRQQSLAQAVDHSSHRKAAYQRLQGLQAWPPMFLLSFGLQLGALLLLLVANFFRILVIQDQARTINDLRQSVQGDGDLGRLLDQLDLGWHLGLSATLLGGGRSSRREVLAPGLRLLEYILLTLLFDLHYHNLVQSLNYIMILPRFFPSYIRFTPSMLDYSPFCTYSRLWSASDCQSYISPCQYQINLAFYFMNSNPLKRSCFVIAIGKLEIPTLFFHLAQVAVAPQSSILAPWLMTQMATSRSSYPTLSKQKSTPPGAISFIFLTRFYDLQFKQQSAPSRFTYQHFQLLPARPITFSCLLLASWTASRPVDEAADDISIIFPAPMSHSSCIAPQAVRPVGPSKLRYLQTGFTTSGSTNSQESFLTTKVLQENTPITSSPTLTLLFEATTLPRPNAGISPPISSLGKQDSAPETHILQTGSRVKQRTFTSTSESLGSGIVAKVLS